MWSAFFSKSRQGEKEEKENLRLEKALNNLIFVLTVEMFMKWCPLHDGVPWPCFFHASNFLHSAKNKVCILWTSLLVWFTGVFSENALNLFLFFCHSRRWMPDWDSVYLDLVRGSATTQKRCFQQLLNLCCLVALLSARIWGQTFIRPFFKMFVWETEEVMQVLILIGTEYVP